MNKYKIESEVSKEGLVGGLYQVLNEVLLEVHGDEMIEDIRDYDLFTNDEDGTSFMCEVGSDILQELALDERVFSLIDTINLLSAGELLKV